LTEKTSDKRLGSMIGLAYKAGRIRSGGFAAEESVRSGTAKLCMVSGDTSEGTMKKFKDMCSHKSIPMVLMDISKEELGHMMGKDLRSVVTVEDEGFAKRILELIEGGNACG
jgi:ribosomal protein L7Ae-like RNA K-turn-binding protein